MSSFELIAQFTKTAQENYVCDRPSCRATIPQGSPYFPISTFNSTKPGRNVCLRCFERYQKMPDTQIRSRSFESGQVPSPDPAVIHKAISASQSKSTVNPPGVLAIPRGYATASGMDTCHPPAQPSRSNASAGMLSSVPVHCHRTAPDVDVPAAWSANSRVQVSNNPGSSTMLPPPAGYNKHHALYSAELERWSCTARTPASAAETIILNISALHEGGHRRGRLHGTPFGNIVEGKKDVDAHITAPGLVAVACQTLDPHIIAFCPGFSWRVDEFIVCDDSWVDLANHPETCLGYFYQDCLQASNRKNSKGLVFKSRSFTLYVVVPQVQWTEYEQFVAKRDGVTPNTTQISTRKSKGIRSCTVSTAGPSHRHRSPSPLPDIISTQKSKGSHATSTTSSISIKRAHKHTGSSSSVTTKSPPTKKLLTNKQNNQESLREALKVGGTADLDIAKVLKNSIYSIDFYPISTVPISLILKSANHHAFNVDPKTAAMHPGQLRLSSGDAFVGAGGFKTAYTATLLLLTPRETGIGSKPCENIIIKRPYIRRPGQYNNPPFRHFGVKEESEKLFREANVLYWAKSLLQVVEDFIANALAKAPDTPPFHIPSIRFVDAGFAFRYSTGPARGSRAPSVDCTYLCEEEIVDAKESFTKFIHNGNCVPLLKPDEIGYDIAQFLAFSQHVQYVETGGLAYISDYQGIRIMCYFSSIGLGRLTTPPFSSIGDGLFCEGNLEKAVELFREEHVCNHFCKWPGFELLPFIPEKGKGKVLDPVVVVLD
ncbi:hypothetical protein JVU11DRAFT_12516 [Chiua virens]|nr:hypothetical protein JVU11DRAFT_12516 [Chiua virens]